LKALVLRKLSEEISREEVEKGTILGLRCKKSCDSHQYIELTVTIQTPKSTYIVPEIKCIKCGARYIYGRVQIIEKEKHASNG
jgi:hypothetical protein